MANNINIKVKNKIATYTGSDKIICGNSDYTVNFEFDSEWNGFNLKTLRVKYNGGYREVAFSGNTCTLPIVSDTLGVEIGVYAGNLETSTPAYIDCVKSILCGDNVHITPPTDVYNQLIALINSGILTGNGISSITLLSTAGRTKTYRIAFTNGEHFDYNVLDGENGTNGTNGQDGNGISSITLLSTAGRTKTYRIAFTNGEHFDYNVLDGDAGTTSWNGITDKPSTFPPSAHNHDERYVSKSTSPNRVYAVDANGNQTTIQQTATQATGDTIPLRNDVGQIVCADPTADNQAATQGWVNTKTNNFPKINSGTIVSNGGYGGNVCVLYSTELFAKIGDIYFNTSEIRIYICVEASTTTRYGEEVCTSSWQLVSDIELPTPANYEEVEPTSSTSSEISYNFSFGASKVLILADFGSNVSLAKTIYVNGTNVCNLYTANQRYFSCELESRNGRLFGSNAAGTTGSKTANAFVTYNLLGGVATPNKITSLKIAIDGTTYGNNITVLQVV